MLQELLKARAEVEDAHEALKAEHRDVQARHSQASSEASSCTLQLADCRSRWAASCPATNGWFLGALQQRMPDCEGLNAGSAGWQI